MNSIYKHILRLSLFLVVISSCYLVDPVISETFIIRKGHHNSKTSIELLESNRLIFEAKFDNTAIYKTNDSIQQFSINKLLGFSDCNDKHHENSARFGWRWINNQLEVLAYAYVDGIRNEKFIGYAELNNFMRYSLVLSKDYYEFSLGHYNNVLIPRSKSCKLGFYYILWPYFGGQERAPHDININVIFIER